MLSCHMGLELGSLKIAILVGVRERKIPSAVILRLFTAVVFLFLIKPMKYHKYRYRQNLN